jgi:hypothetical protein
MQKSTFFLIFFIFPILLFSQEQSENTPKIVKQINARFVNYWHNLPQEKIYIHTDKPYYNAGEDIWFRAYLLNATSHMPNTKSRYVYVELIDKGDSLINRVKIRKDSLFFSGKISLKPELQAGDYSLRAYTSWMQNATKDFFFNKKIHIGNSINDKIVCTPEFQNNKKGELNVLLTFANSSKTPLSGKRIVISPSWTKKKYNAVTNPQGVYSLNLNNDTTIKQQNKFVSVIMDEPGVKFDQKFFIPAQTKDFDIQFFPESGSFLDDAIQTIAFKAIGNDGLSVEVEGSLFDNKNEEIATFSSAHKGMGRFAFKTNPGETYYAIVKTTDGLKKSFQLPPTQPTGISLNLLYNRGRVLYNVMNQSLIPTQSLYLLIHCRGFVVIMARFKNNEGQIPEANLPEGINSFSIVDSLGNVYCERMFFSYNFANPEIHMTSDKTHYGKREPVSLTFNLLSRDSVPLKGSYSLSITDSKTVLQDSLSGDIKSYLLLTSDLKGYVEEPGSYFVGNPEVNKPKMDLLMLTQGWKRFNTQTLINGKMPVNKYYLEIGQAVSGKVLNILNKPAKGKDVILLSPYKNRISMAKTDSTGRFVINGIEFPDSTGMLVKAVSKSKIADVEVICDKDSFPKTETYIPAQRSPKNIIPDEYLSLSKEKFYSEGGMLMVNLGEFTVTGQQKTNEPQGVYYSPMADNILTEEKLKVYAGMNVLDILGTIPGVSVNGDQVSIRGGRDNPLFVIDDIEALDINDLKYLSSFEIQSIYVYKGASAAIFGSRGANGVIAIALKKGVINSGFTPVSIARLSPLGYQKPAEFYMPKYEVDSIRLRQLPDLRTTVYWNPALVSDSLGRVNVKFYTADKANNYSVTLEGVSEMGEICRYKGILCREN